MLLISDIPFVAAGYTLKALRNVNLQQILNGEVSIIDGNYLIVLILSALLIFALGFLNILLNKRVNKI